VTRAKIKLTNNKKYGSIGDADIDSKAGSSIATKSRTSTIMHE